MLQNQCTYATKHLEIVMFNKLIYSTIDFYSTKGLNKGKYSEQRGIQAVVSNII